ncbi:hypothetical protein D4100_08190 [Serratia inhibens]|uniref:Uncharacterized protein n=1 Tax=Serratia inhibens TaxID=2338073 RepID=A0AA92X7M4_9GAMM|nr:hypothetical protein D4100_08190 [Serratia inhibens]
MPEKSSLIPLLPRCGRISFRRAGFPRDARLIDSAFSSEQHLLCDKKLAMVRHYRLPSHRPRQYNDFRYH